ncbi:complement C3-like isoform X1 [Argiope bruennichi]|nr:complement C3-like isoform X1 [Argiope bruennichi]
MSSGVRWLINNQQWDGSFVEMSHSYCENMAGGVHGKIYLTAFVFLTLEECKSEDMDHILEKDKAILYLENNFSSVNQTLAVSVVAYALFLSDRHLKEEANDRLMSVAKRDQDSNFIYWEANGQAASIEATSYALLSRILQKDMRTCNSIVNWLNTQRLQSGSFKSTQDTTIGLQALSEYAIKAPMLSIELVVDISSSADESFKKYLKFEEENAHVLQVVKVNKVDGNLLIKTTGHGIVSLEGKLRYNVITPKEKMCKFDLSVNVSELEMDTEDDDLISKIDPRSRPRQIPILGDGLHLKGAKRSKRKAVFEDSELIMNVSICVRYLGNKTTGMTIVEIGIFSGFHLDEEDLRKLQYNPKHKIERYEKSSKGLILYLKTVPNNEPYCFDFYVVRDYIVGETLRSSIKVYDHYNHVWKGQVVKEINQENGLFNITFEIDEVIQEGIEKNQQLQFETRQLFIRDKCVPMLKNKTYLIMGKDEESYTRDRGQLQRRYLLDQSSIIHPWTSIKEANNRYLQRALDSLVRHLKKESCLE